MRPTFITSTLSSVINFLQKLDEIQVKVVVADIDDNGPTFLAHNMTLGKPFWNGSYATSTIVLHLNLLNCAVRIYN